MDSGSGWRAQVELKSAWLSSPALKTPREACPGAAGRADRTRSAQGGAQVKEGGPDTVIP